MGRKRPWAEWRGGIAVAPTMRVRALLHLGLGGKQAFTGRENKRSQACNNNFKKG